MADDLEIVQSGDTPGPKYDSDTDMVIEEDGNRRVPRYEETVRAAVEKQKVDRNPTLQNYERAKRSGTDWNGLMADLQQLSAQKSPHDQVAWLERRLGIDYVAEKLRRTQGVDATTHHANEVNAHVSNARAAFDARHPTIGKDHPQRLAAVKLITDGDKRLGVLNRQSALDTFEKAFQLAAEHASPTARVNAEMARRADKATI